MEKFASFEKLKRGWLKNKELKKAYDNLGPEFEIIRSIISARIKNGITQKEFARRMKTTQSAISRFESGAYNPTVSFLKRAATALESKLTISIR